MPVSARVQEKLSLLPDRPGVYVYRDDAGKILYVGKAVNLKNRVRSYFQEGGGHSPRIVIMVPRDPAATLRCLRASRAAFIGHR